MEFKLFQKEIVGVFHIEKENSLNTFLILILNDS